MFVEAYLLQLLINLKVQVRGPFKVQSSKFKVQSVAASLTALCEEDNLLAIASGSGLTHSLALLASELATGRVDVPAR